MSSDKCRERFEPDAWGRGLWLDRHPERNLEYYFDRTQFAWELWQVAWTASREEAAKELASAVPLFDESTPIYDVPVTYIDGGAMLPPKLAEDANADD